MKILMPVLWFDEPPGGWTYFKGEAERLAHEGHEVVVVCPHQGRPYSGSERVRVYRCSSTYLVARAFVIHPLSFLRCMAEVIRNEGKFDLILDETSGAYPVSFAAWLWLRLKGRRTPILVHVRGQLKDLAGRGITSALFEAYLHTVTRLSYAVADRVLISGENIRERVERLGAAPEKVAVIPFAVKHSGPVPQEDYVRESLGIANDAFVIGNVGRPTRAKGVDTLIRAFRLADIPGAVLLLVGEDPERRDMQALADRLGISSSVRLLGYRRDVPRLLQAMDVFANLSLSEGGVSGAQLEAMAAGLSSIVTPFDAQLTQKETMTVEFGDYEGAARALKTLHAFPDFRRQMGENAKKKAAEIAADYSWERYVPAIGSAFRDAGL